MISTNAGGTNVLRYGMTRQLVLGLEVVLSNGEIVDGLRHLRKDNADYDWKQLFIGSEGTLGVVTSAVLRLVPQPTHRATALLACPSPKAALMLLARSQDTLGETITAFELISAFSFGLVAKHFKRALPIDAAPWFVLLEVSSSLGGICEAMEEMLAEAFEANEATDGVIAETEAQRLSIWALREHITEAEQREAEALSTTSPCQ
nr:FAD linked oxidases, C-terminal domain protein [uncultured bacterium]